MYFITTERRSGVAPHKPKSSASAGEADRLPAALCRYHSLLLYLWLPGPGWLWGHTGHSLMREPQIWLQQPPTPALGLRR